MDMGIHELRLGGNRCVEFTTAELQAALEAMHNNFEGPVSEEVTAAWDKLMTLLQASRLLQGTVKLTF